MKHKPLKSDGGYNERYGYVTEQIISAVEGLKRDTKEVVKDLNYLFSKINWKTSFLDAKAIEIMNTFEKRLTPDKWFPIVKPKEAEKR